MLTDPFKPEASPEEIAQFLASLALRACRRRTVRVVSGWLDRLAALEAARITGAFARRNPRNAPPRSRRLGAHARLSANSPSPGQAENENQLNRRVELNLKIKCLYAELPDAEDLYADIRHENTHCSRPRDQVS